MPPVLCVLAGGDSRAKLRPLLPHLAHYRDVWSFGTFCWEVFGYGKRPWGFATVDEIKADISTWLKAAEPAAAAVTRDPPMARPALCSDDNWKMIVACWSPAKARPTLELINADIVLQTE